MTAVASRTSNPTVELRDSSALLGDPEALLERAAVDGYLFFRGLLQRDRVLDVRRQIMQVVADHGWLQPGTDPMEGIADVEAFDRVDPVAAAFCGTGVPLHAYQQIYRLQDFHAIGHDRALLDLYDGLLGGNAIRQPLSIARVHGAGHPRRADARPPGLHPHPGHHERVDGLVPARRLPGRARAR